MHGRISSLAFIHRLLSMKPTHQILFSFGVGRFRNLAQSPQDLQWDCTPTSHGGTGSTPWEPRLCGIRRALFFFVRVYAQRALICWFTFQMRARSGTPARLSREWQGPKYLACHPLPPRGHNNRKQGSGSAPGIEQGAPAGDTGVFKARPGTCQRGCWWCPPRAAGGPGVWSKVKAWGLVCTCPPHLWLGQ